jgi:tRNA/rRNA methyltransferase/tRNA (cytidine32/uridine32-2'-O)-methyltransferase
MKNMDLSRLRVTGLSPPDLAPVEGEIRSRAVHAVDVWERTEYFDTLEAAAADCAILAGTTRRRGRKRKNVTLDSRELALWLREKPGKAALAFGNERTGLEDAELDLCNIASHIPVSDAFPSLNLSHAVQIYAYELYRALGLPEAADAAGAPLPVKGAWVPLTRKEVDALTAGITGNLESLGFYRHPGREEQARFIRDFISRAGLSEREGKYLADIFAKAARMGGRQSGNTSLPDSPWPDHHQDTE